MIKQNRKTSTENNNIAIFKYTSHTGEPVTLKIACKETTDENSALQ
jgi:hypothetical protein